MTRLTLCLLLGIAACGPALAQSSITVRVSPPLGQDDFRLPMTCAAPAVCAMVAPALANLNSPERADNVPAPAMLLQPTPRPDALSAPAALPKV